MLLLNSFITGVGISVATSMNALVSSGSLLEFWDGSPPAGITDPDAGVRVAACPLSNPFLASSSGNTFFAGAITSDTATVAGTIQYWRIKDPSNNTLFQGTVGVGTGEIQFDGLTFGTGDTCAVTGLSFNMLIF